MQNLADACVETQLLLQRQRPEPGGSSSASGDRPAMVRALTQLVLLMDALSAYHGEDGDLDESTVTHFLAAAAAADAETRIAALAAAGPALVSGRWKGIASGGAWVALSADLKQSIQLPGSRSKRRKVH